MNWDAIGAVGEILGAMGVLITLIYLTTQIRQNTRAMKSTALLSVRDFNRITENNERYVAALMKSQRKEALALEDFVHMVERFLTIMREFETIWNQQQVGVLSQAQFEQHLDLLRWAVSTPESRLMWAQLAPAFDPEFRNIVDSEALAEEAPTSVMTQALSALLRHASNKAK